MTEASFRSYVVRALRQRDFAGAFATISVAHDGVTLKGDEKGFLHVPFARVARMRVGFTEAKQGLIYETRIWLEGEAKPLRLFPDRENLPAYGASIRGIADGLARVGRSDRVEGGVSVFEASLGPALMAPVVLFGLLAATISADPPVWWHFIVIPLIPAVVFGVLVWRSVTRHWPRRLASRAELDLQLP
jgi:hypothetical protein